MLTLRQGKHKRSPHYRLIMCETVNDPKHSEIKAEALNKSNDIIILLLNALLLAVIVFGIVCGLITL